MSGMTERYEASSPAPLGIDPIMLQEVVQLLIRPPRRNYFSHHLGPSRSLVGKTWVNRLDEVPQAQLDVCFT